MNIKAKAVCSFTLVLTLAILATGCAHKNDKMPESTDPQKSYNDTIRASIRSSTKTFQNCYDGLLKKYPKAKRSGRMILKWLIIEKGEVRDTKIVSSDFKNKDFESCMVAAVNKISFAEPKANVHTEVVYPFSFSEEPGESLGAKKNDTTTVVEPQDAKAKANEKEVKKSEEVKKPEDAKKPETPKETPK